MILQSTWLVIVGFVCLSTLPNQCEASEASGLGLMHDAVTTACDFSHNSFTGRLRFKRQSAEGCGSKIKSCEKVLAPSTKDEPSCGDISNTTLCIKDAVDDDCHGNIRQMYLASFVHGFLSVTCKDDNNSSSNDTEVDPLGVTPERRALVKKVSKTCSVQYLRKVIGMSPTDPDKDSCCGILEFLRCLVNLDPDFLPKSGQEDFISSSYTQFKNAMPGCDTFSQQSCGN